METCKPNCRITVRKETLKQGLCVLGDAHWVNGDVQDASSSQQSDGHRAVTQTVVITMVHVCSSTILSIYIPQQKAGVHSGSIKALQGDTQITENNLPSPRPRSNILIEFKEKTAFPPPPLRIKLMHSTLLKMKAILRVPTTNIQSIENNLQN